MDLKFSHKTLQDYEVLSVIGNGCFGTCYKVRDKTTNEMFVWKSVNYDEPNGTSKEALTREIDMMRQLQHPNIVQYYHHLINEEAKSIFFFLECCEGGDLAQLISKARTECKRFEERYIWRVLFQLSKALQLCHTRLSNGTLLHRDIKPANIFLDTAGNAKLGDFGLARMLNGGEKHFAQTIVGTPYYMSPELICGAQYNHTSDVWALGCLIYELCSLQPPFRGRDCIQLSNNISSGNFNQIPTIYSLDLQSIINSMLSVKSEERPGIEVISRHPIVVRNIKDLGSEFPQLVQMEHEKYSMGRACDGKTVRCKLQYSPAPDLSSTCSLADSIMFEQRRLSVSGVFTPDLRAELFYSAKRRIFSGSTFQCSDPQLYETVRQEDNALDTETERTVKNRPSQLTRNIFDDMLQSRLKVIRAQESLLNQRELNLNERELQLSQWEKRLQEKERELTNKTKSLSLTQPLPLPLPPSSQSTLQSTVVALCCPKTIMPPPIPPRKPKTHDDTYCSIESSDSLLHSPTMAKINLAALPASKVFPTIRRVTFQSPKKFIKYDIENIPPLKSITTQTNYDVSQLQASISSKSSHDSNETSSRQHRRKSLLSSIFSLHRSNTSSKNTQSHTTIKKATDIATVKESIPTVSKCETTELTTMWTKEHKRAAFDLLAAMNAAEAETSKPCDINMQARHKLRHSARNHSLQRNRLRRSVITIQPPSTYDHIKV